MQSVMILGRQPELGLAELESLYGAAALTPLGDHAVIVDVDPCLLAFDRLGGSVKFCKLLTTQPTTAWPKLARFLKQAAPVQVRAMPAGKMRLGLSAIGLKVTPGELNATALTLKKVIRATGRSVRVVPNQSLELNTAQVIHNQLTGPTGWELVCIRDGSQTVIAQTVKVQDIDRYAARDRGRPKRDAKVGMLPPKLAQIIINLAVGKLPADTLRNICNIPGDHGTPHPRLGQTILDPFCGTGVILQEATLMGYDIYGSDLEPRMVDYTTQNLRWLESVYRIPYTVYGLEAGDATKHQWRPGNEKWEMRKGKWPLAVASELYLGRPFTERPSAEILAQTVAECNLIIKKFLNNIHPQLPAGARLCLAVPAWNTGTINDRRLMMNENRGGRPLVNRQSSIVNRFKSLPLIDQMSDLGYNLISFEHGAGSDLIYCRDDQIVGRQLLVLTRV